MRLTKVEIETVTGLTQHAAQVRWFKQHFAVIVSCDRTGPIMTNTAFEALVFKRYGLKNTELTNEAKPTVKMREFA